MIDLLNNILARTRVNRGGFQRNGSPPWPRCGEAAILVSDRGASIRGSQTQASP